MKVLPALGMVLSTGLSTIVAGCGAGSVDGAVGLGMTQGTGGTSGGGAAGAGVGASLGTGGGAAGSSGSSAITITNPGTDGGGNNMLNPDAACVATAMQGEQRPVALFFMMDNSGSMTTIDRGETQTRWELISTAVPAFLANPANVGLYAGLDFFPEVLMADAGAGRNGGGNNNANNASCNVADYENPNVPIGIIPGPNNAQVNAFGTAINTRVVQGQTPTTPALEGALHSASLWQTAHPEMSTFVVFMTDGQPNGCNSSVANAAAAAAAGVGGTPAIKTYVLGVGPQVGNLDAIAVGGGTGPTAYLVATGGADALTATLNLIKGTAVSCSYKVPTTSGAALDFAKVNVQTTVGPSGTPTLVDRVDGLAACGTQSGWYYDQPIDGGAPPTTITLCPSACAPLTATNGSSLQILIGCKAVTRIQ
jgi:hypothetical protein